MLAASAAEIETARGRQHAAFAAERWKAEGLDSFVADEAVASEAAEIPPGCEGVPTTVPGNVWKVLVGEGEFVAAGQTVPILESMKMEEAVTAPVGGRVREIRAGPGRTRRGGDLVAILEP